jgi:MFS family permease
MYWWLQHMRTLPELADWTPAEVNKRVSTAFWLIMATSIAGNFLAAALARGLGYRKAIVILCVSYFASMTLTYGTHRGPDVLWFGLAAGGISQGVFALFTMYLPPLFPTLLRTTGAGFCYNFGRIAAGLGTVAFGYYFSAADSRLAIFWAAFLFLPAAAVAMWLHEPPDEVLPLPNTGLAE